MKPRTVLFLAAGLVVVMLPQGALGSGKLTMVAEMRGAQEVPPVNSQGRGCGVFTIDTQANTLAYYIAFTGLSSPETAAHIHGPAGPGSNAGVKQPLPLGNPKVGVWNYAEADEADILAGLMYVNIHTQNNPGGEIRGQIADYVAALDGFQENPPTGSSGRGWAVFRIDTGANTLEYHIVIESLMGVETAAHIHGFGVHGDNTGVVHPLPLGSPKVGVWNYDEADEQAILDGRTYVNVHSDLWPGGEIRGQIVNIVAPMDGTQEVPPVNTPAAGCGMFSIDRDADLLGYYIFFSNLLASETAAHIHGFAGRGSNAGVLEPLPLGSPKVGAWNYNAADEDDILAGLTYVNVHSSAHPGGEIRGQIEFPLFKAPGVPGDCDGDGDVDIADFSTFATCFTGSGGSPPPGCECADLDGDGDVDISDFSTFAANFTGSQ